MRRSHLLIGAVALLGLGACADQAATPATGTPAAAAAPAPREERVPVFNMGGQQITTVPASQVRGTPRGVPILVNRGGENITVTVGSPPAPATVTAGRVGRVTTDTSGRVVMERIGPGRGDMSRPGTPVFVGTGEGGRPLFEMRD